MRKLVCSLVVGLFLTSMLAGCGGDSTTGGASAPDDRPADIAATTPTGDETPADTPADETSGAAGSPADGAAAGGAPAAAAGSSDFALTPDNTMIQFVGVHTGDKPDPRTGTFAAVTGTATIADGQLKALEVNIDTTSLQTDIEKLTNHLKSPDFFNVNEHPKASYVSTEIGPVTDGKVSISGNLTLLGQTKPVNFDAEVTLEGGLQLKGEFTIDRTEFGMDYSVDRVDKAVSMTVTVGH